MTNFPLEEEKEQGYVVEEERNKDGDSYADSLFF